MGFFCVSSIFNTPTNWTVSILTLLSCLFQIEAPSFNIQQTKQIHYEGHMRHKNIKLDITFTGRKTQEKIKCSLRLQDGLGML